MKRGPNQTDKEVMQELVAKAKYYQYALQSKATIPQCVNFD